MTTATVLAALALHHAAAVLLPISRSAFALALHARIIVVCRELSELAWAGAQPVDGHHPLSDVCVGRADSLRIRPEGGGAGSSVKLSFRGRFLFTFFGLRDPQVNGAARLVQSLRNLPLAQASASQELGDFPRADAFLTRFASVPSDIVQHQLPLIRTLRDA